MDRFVNTALLGHPLNWVITFTMLAMGLTFLQLMQPAMQQFAGTTSRIAN